MPDNKTIWTTKAPDMEFDTFEVSHPMITTRRYVLNQFDAITLNGNLYTPAAATPNYPTIDSDVSPSFSIDMSRPVVGDELENAMNEITPIGRILNPVTCTLSHWIETDLAAPMMTYTMYLDDTGITMNQDTVTISCSRDNPMTNRVAMIYDADEWSGLESS